MKKLLLLAMLVTSIGLAAKGKELSPDYPRHSLEVTIGDPFMATQMTDAFSHTYFNPYRGPYDKADFWTGHYTLPYRSSGYTTPAINLTYHYAVRHWLHIGPKLSYYTEGHNYKDQRTGNLLYKNDIHFFSAMADVRFQYFERPNIRLYSGVAMGIGLGFERNNGKTDLIASPAWQITAFGLSAGQKVYFNMELGFGVEGFGKIGIGYRF